MTSIWFAKPRSSAGARRAADNQITRGEHLGLPKEDELDLPARNGELIDVHRAGALDDGAVELEVGQQCGSPAESEGRVHGGIDWLLDAVQHHGTVCHIAGVIA